MVVLELVAGPVLLDFELSPPNFWTLIAELCVILPLDVSAEDGRDCKLATPGD